MIHGYARVSTDGQSVTAQVAALQEAGAVKVWCEVASGAKTDRAQLRKAIAALEPSDVLMVVRGDRAARFVRDMLNLLAQIIAKGAAFCSLAEAWADTRDQTAMGRLVRTIMAGFAEFERELIRERTSEGRTRAKECGVKLSRKPKLTQHQQREAAKRREKGEAVREIARSYAVHHSTISRLPSHG